MLRNEGAQSTFLGLEITNTSMGFEVENSTDLVEFLLNFDALENSKPTANPGGSSTVMKLATAIPLDGHDYSNFRTNVGKHIFIALWRPDMQFAMPQLSTQVLDPTTESKRAVKQLIRYLKGTHKTCLRLEPHKMVQKGLLKLVGRSDSDWARDSATRQSVTGDHCNVRGVMLCKLMLKQTVISLSSCEAEFYAAGACAGELLGLAELFKELHYNVSVRLEMDSARHILQRRGPGGVKHNEIRCLVFTTMDQKETNIGWTRGYERHPRRSLQETSEWTENAVALMETWATRALPVEQCCKYSKFQQLTE